MKYNNPVIEAAALTNIRAGVMQPGEILKRYLQKQRILKLAGNKPAPRSKGEPTGKYTVLSPKETIKRARQKKRIKEMCK